MIGFLLKFFFTAENQGFFFSRVFPGGCILALEGRKSF